MKLPTALVTLRSDSGSAAHGFERLDGPIAVTRSTGLDVSASLLHAGQCWHTQVELAEADDPVLLVELALEPKGLPQVAIGLVPCQPVHDRKVPEEFFAAVRLSDEGNVLDGVAPGAEGLEAAEPLIAGPGVELPDLVAVQPVLTAAGAASISGPLVGGSSEPVPLGRRQKLGQTGQA